MRRCWRRACWQRAIPGCERLIQLGPSEADGGVSFEARVRAEGPIWMVTLRVRGGRQHNRVELSAAGEWRGAACTRDAARSRWCGTSGRRCSPTASRWRYLKGRAHPPCRRRRCARWRVVAARAWRRRLPTSGSLTAARMTGGGDGSLEPRRECEEHGTPADRSAGGVDGGRAGGRHRGAGVGLKPGAAAGVAGVMEARAEAEFHHRGHRRCTEGRERGRGRHSFSVTGSRSGVEPGDLVDISVATFGLLVRSMISTPCGRHVRVPQWQRGADIGDRSQPNRSDQAEARYRRRDRRGGPAAEVGQGVQGTLPVSRRAHALVLRVSRSRGRGSASAARRAATSSPS